MKRSIALLSVAVTALFLAVGGPATPVGAATGTADLALSLRPTCTGGGSATYTWSHWGSFHPKQVELFVIDETDSQNPQIVVGDVEPARGSGTVSVTFDEINGHSYEAQGSLYRLLKGFIRQPIAESSRISDVRLASCT
jgi:hypothetical protein